MSFSDFENPIIICSDDIITTTDQGKPSAVVIYEYPNATDNSGHVYVNGSHNSGSEFAIGTTTVSYYATDATGNSDRCNFSVTVIGMLCMKALCDTIIGCLKRN